MPSLRQRPLHCVGYITEWNDSRGFGFITPVGRRRRIFFHITAFDRAPTRPDVGMHISFDLLEDESGRFSATHVQVLPPRPQKQVVAGKVSPRLAIGVAFLAVIAWGVHSAKIPPVVTFAYGIMSLVAMRLYHIDKFAAVNHQWRTRESTLHIVGLLGGWPGALFAQELYRHKSKKLKFQHVFLLTVVLNCVGLAWLIVSGWELRLPVEKWLEWFVTQDWSSVIPVKPELIPVEPELPRITPLNHAW